MVASYTRIGEILKLAIEEPCASDSDTHRGVCAKRFASFVRSCNFFH